MKIECENLSVREATPGPKDHTHYRYYLRITQKMKGGRKLSWSYRLPLE